VEINVLNNEEKEIYLDNSSNAKITFNIGSNATLKVYEYSFDSSRIRILNINGENSKLEYHYSTININDNNYKIEVNHNKGNTISNIYNHGINVKDKKLVFDVTGKVLKESSKCVTNQENQIINLSNGNSLILPNLLIDNYDITSSHAAYIGKFKDELIYYLMSRGISKYSAIKMLVKSLLLNGGDSNSLEFSKYLEKIEKIGE
jgi:Fe-S cluster assembly scaffold protein SufB